MEQQFGDAAYLDISAPDFAMDSDAVRDARARNFYARTNYGLAILRYDAVDKLVTDPRLRQGSYAWPAHNGATGSFADWWSGMIINKEGEDHRRLRRIANGAFQPKILRPLVPQFEMLANELIDAFIDRGDCEFMAGFSEPYATRVLCILLGTPPEDWRQLADWALEMGLALGVTYRRDMDRINAATDAMTAYCASLVERRRRNLTDDFLSTLIRQQDVDPTFSDEEMLNLMVGLVLGGIDTTRNQLGLGLDLLMRHPGQWELLANDPALARNAVEEVMRCRPTTTWVTREALEDFEFQGLEIKGGTTVHLFTAAAGTDPLKISDEEFDITKTRPLHFGFGKGPHFCVGQFVARTDMGVALTVLPARMHVPRENGEVRWFPDSGNTGPISFPIAFEKRA